MKRRLHKNLMLAIISCITAVIIMSCSSKETNITPDIVNTDNQNDFEVKSDKDMLIEDLVDAVKLPDEYFIKYEIETKEGMIEYVTKAKDVQGNIYYKSKDEEMLFVAAIKGYIKYEPEDNGKFVKADSAIYMDKYIDEVTQDFMNYAKKSDVKSSGVAQFTGTQVIAERMCDMFKIRLKLSIFTQEYIFGIDQETGVCMKWAESSDIAGHDVSSAENYKCIEIYLENVEISAVSELNMNTYSIH